MSDGPVLVAHRAGNRPASARSALGRVHLIELDVHRHRGRLEVRHEKVLWPTSRLWERWFLLPRGTSVSTLEEVLAAIGPDAALLLDLKCFTPRSARCIRRAVGDRQPILVSTRSWWLLREFSDRPGTVMLRSCGSRRQLWFALRLPGLSDRCGIVAHERLLDNATIRAIRSATSTLYTWAVPSVERGADLAAAGVTGLIVDDLDLDWRSI